MNRKRKLMALALLVLAMALVLTGCSEEEAKHPLVAKWSQLYEDGQLQLMFSFENVGDMEICVWRPDEEGKLAQSEFYIGTYAVDDENGTIALTMEDSSETVFDYSIVDTELRLSNEQYDLALVRSAENSANTK